MCTGSHPESTLHLAGCQKTNEQILPLSGCSLPSPYTSKPCPEQTGASGAAAGLGAWKNPDPTKKKREDQNVARSRPACGAGAKHRAGSPTLLSRHLLGRMSISSEHKPLGKQVTGNLHTVSKVRLGQHSFLLWDQSIPFGLHQWAFFPSHLLF